MKKNYLLLLIVLLSAATKAQTISFPDPALKAKLLSPYVAIDAAENAMVLDTNHDGEIQVAEAQNVYKLILSNAGISDLTGIGYFTNLRWLDCSANQLTALHLNPLVHLQTLKAFNNQLSGTLDLSALTDMKDLTVQSNQLTGLNLSGLLKIENLGCQDNQLTTLEIDGFPTTGNGALDCSNNSISSLTLNNARFFQVRCMHNNMQSLVFSGTNNIQNLYAGNNALTALDLSSLVGVNTISLPYNQISQISFPTNMNSVQTIDMNSNLLTELNFNATYTSQWQSPNLGFNYNQIATATVNIQGMYNGRLNLMGNPLAHAYLTINGPTGNYSQVNITDICPDFQLDGNAYKLLITNSVATAADFSWTNAKFIEFNYSPNLAHLNIKNGKADNMLFGDYAPALQYVCADDNDVLSEIYIDNAEVNPYCSFVPGGQYYEIAGSTNMDVDNNGCGGDDPIMHFSKYRISNGTVVRHLTSDATGHYSIPVVAGTYTLSPVFEHPSYFNVAPASAVITFPASTNTLTQQFCATANGYHPDLEVTIVPLNVPRPGFDAAYKIIYKNNGNVPLSGYIYFNFDYRTQYVSATQTPDVLTTTSAAWVFSDLMVFEEREISVILHVNSPTETPAVNGGNVLHHSVNGLIPDVTDETPDDNTQYLNQTVVNSFDPNDKTCLEGTLVGPDDVGKYVHYVIRFENTGTANAENIVVVDQIDAAKFDVSTLVPLDGSHDFHTRINGNKVEFIFENIQLPFDDANNDGYVAFKIKTQPNLVVGDSFSNAASIYFDYNHPIVTDPAVTTVSLLKNVDFEFADEFAIYPNPANDALNIQSKNNTEIQSIGIYNTLGQLVIATVNAKNFSAIDVSRLETGNYFVKIRSDKGESNAKFLKK